MSGTTPQGGFWNNWKNSAIPAQGSTISTPNASGTNVGYRGTTTGGIAADPFIADLIAISDADRLVISKLLVDAGYLRKATKKYNKDFGDAWSLANMEFATERSRTGRPDLTIRQFLVENTQPPSGTGAGKAPNLPTRQIYDVPRAQIEADVDNAAQNILGRTIQAEDKTQDWYKNLVKSVNDMYQKGVVTTSKEVVNPVTGKKERQVIQKPGYSKDKIATQIKETVTAASPVDVERKQTVDFTKWLFSQMGGQG